jgi:hypothetical protein
MPKSNTKEQIDEDDGWSVYMKSAVALLGGITLAGLIIGILLFIIALNFH